MKVIIAPNDLRAGGAVLHEEAPASVGQLYRTVADVRGMPKATKAFK